MEERIYRLRCVEGWSMVIPWIGYSLSELLKRVEPMGSAKYVEFVTLADPGHHARCAARACWTGPMWKACGMDEAMHPLTLLAFGMYGEVLPNQNGAPRAPGGAVEVRLQERQDHWSRSAWSSKSRAPPGTRPRRSEYGFYSNVNPNVDAPALEPGHRAPHWRRRPVRQEAQDADVQWLSRPRSASCTRAWTSSKFY